MMVNLSCFYVAVVLFMAILTMSSPSFFIQSMVHDALQNLKEKTSHDCVKEGIFTPVLITTLYFGKQKQFVGRRHLESPSLPCFMNQIRVE